MNVVSNIESMCALESMSAIESMSAYFHALSDPIRLKVIERLMKKEMCVSDLCDSLNLKQPKLSFHLKILRESGFVNSRQEGRWVYYGLNERRFNFLKNYLNNIFK